MLGVIAMGSERTPYNPTPGDYDTDKLTDLHSKVTDPSWYARNIKDTDSYKSIQQGIKSETEKDTTERIPTLVKYSDMNRDDDEIEYKGEI
jgi:hypothetical protein